MYIIHYPKVTEEAKHIGMLLKQNNIPFTAQKYVLTSEPKYVWMNRGETRLVHAPTETVYDMRSAVEHIMTLVKLGQTFTQDSSMFLNASKLSLANGFDNWKSCDYVGHLDSNLCPLTSEWNNSFVGLHSNAFLTPVRSDLVIQETPSEMPAFISEHHTGINARLQQPISQHSRPTEQQAEAPQQSFTQQQFQPAFMQQEQPGMNYGQHAYSRQYPQAPSASTNYGTQVHPQQPRNHMGQGYPFYQAPEHHGQQTPMPAHTLYR